MITHEKKQVTTTKDVYMAKYLVNQCLCNFVFNTNFIRSGYKAETLSSLFQFMKEYFHFINNN